MQSPDNIDNENDRQRARWAELVKDAKADVYCNVPSLYSHTVIWAEAERLTLSIAIADAARLLDIAATKLEAMEKRFGEMVK